MAASENLVLGAIFSAKVKTVCQIVAISLLIIYNQLGQFERLAPISLWLALVTSIYSGLEYFLRYAPVILQGRVSHDS